MQNDIEGHIDNLHGLPCHLLRLPFELRQRILSIALKQQGTLELQRPMWADEELVFNQPLFKVCRMLREQGLEAFYKANSFLWIIDIEHGSRSDPAEYPLPSRAHMLTPFWPWRYPHTLEFIRHLHLNVYLPSDLHDDDWNSIFPAQLVRLVESLERGRKLLDLHVLLTTKRYGYRISMRSDHRRTLDILSQLEVRGKVHVMMRYDFKEVRQSIETLQLEKRMKA